MNEPPNQAEAVRVHEALMTLMVRMIGEHPELAAGSVMRCVARAFRGAVMAGTPYDEIPATVERSARQALAKRVEDFPRSRAVPSRGARATSTRPALRWAG